MRLGAVKPRLARNIAFVEFDAVVLIGRDLLSSIAELHFPAVVPDRGVHLARQSRLSPGELLVEGLALDAADDLAGAVPDYEVDGVVVGGGREEAATEGLAVAVEVVVFEWRRWGEGGGGDNANYDEHHGDEDECNCFLRKSRHCC